MRCNLILYFIKISLILLLNFSWKKNDNMPILNFDMDSQMEGFWCWAAVAKGVSDFYNRGSEFTQCSIAQQVLNVPNCCPQVEACNQTEDLKTALMVTGNFVQKKRKISWAKLENELINGRVVAARIQFRSGAGHFIVLYGTSENGGVRYVSVNDPAVGVGYLLPTLGELRTNYRQDTNGEPGKWTNTYLTQ